MKSSFFALLILTSACSNAVSTSDLQSTTTTTLSNFDDIKAIFDSAPMADGRLEISVGNCKLVSSEHFVAAIGANKNSTAIYYTDKLGNTESWKDGIFGRKKQYTSVATKTVSSTGTVFSLDLYSKSQDEFYYFNHKTMEITLNQVGKVVALKANSSAAGTLFGETGKIRLQKESVVDCH